jgi:hypothetical protein
MIQLPKEKNKPPSWWAFIVNAIRTQRDHTQMG